MAVGRTEGTDIHATNRVHGEIRHMTEFGWRTGLPDDLRTYEFVPGPWKREISTGSPEAQAWFDRGLNWMYAFNHEEAVACFRAALEFDPDCAMAWWGIALAGGPFYNRPWVRYTRQEIAETLPLCHNAAIEARRALERCSTITPCERALIKAIASRYRSRDETCHRVLDRWHREFTDEMRVVHAAFLHDLDVTALFAEAAVTCTPRRLWDLGTGRPDPDALTEEVMSVLEAAMSEMRASGIRHPGILHMYVHLMEMSPYPERALPAADMLRGLSADGGHLEHMAAHIDVLCGDYARAVEQGRRAIQADDRYLRYAGPENFYTTARCHDLHLQMYAAMFLGQYGTAIAAAERICTTATPELVAASFPFMASILDGYSAMRTHVLVRFGKWRDLVEDRLPEDTERIPIRVAMHHYGKGIAHSALGEIENAEAAAKRFERSFGSIPDGDVFLSNSVREILGVGKAMLEGELEYRKGNHEVAFDLLRLSVRRDDNLNYTEPWAWMHPPRHALGALLAEQGRYAEAEIVYRADLGYTDSVARCCQHPDNVWAIHGLLECVNRKGDRAGAEAEAELLRQRLTVAQARTDVPVMSSCFCRSRQDLSRGIAGCAGTDDSK